LRESRAGRFTAKAMEAAKILEAQPRGTPRRMRARNVQMVAAGTGEALPGRNGLAVPVDQCGPITGEEPGNGRRAGREPEAVVVPIEPGGQHNHR
jgi:hypothetical protein